MLTRLTTKHGREGGSSEGTGNYHGRDTQVYWHLRVHGCVGTAFNSYYWSYQTEALHCEEVAGSLSRNCFQYILKCLHVAPKIIVVYNKQHPRYNRLVQVHWLMSRLILNFQTHWNGSKFLTVDESMVAYNRKFYAFKQYLLLKSITHGIKVWYLCCFVTKYILNWEVYVGTKNEAVTNLPQHACGSSAGVVTKLTMGWEGR